MKVLLVLPAASIYDMQGRVAGWRHTPASHDSLKQLKTLAPRLHELGVTRVVASDLDEQSAKALSNKLKVPCELWQSLRKFGLGVHHGMKQAQFKKFWARMQKEWVDNPNIPVQGGDSLASYHKRLNGTRERLLTVPHPPIVVVVDSTTAKDLFGLSVLLEHNHIYEVNLARPDAKTEAVAAAAK